MRGASCEELELLIEREGFGWSEAERLRVEQHLSGCAGCRELLATSRFVRDTLRAAQQGLSEAARGRALAGAFAGAARASERRGGRARRLWLGLGAGAVLSAAAAAALLVWSGAEPRARLAQPEPAHSAPEQHAANGAREPQEPRGSAHEQEPTEQGARQQPAAGAAAAPERAAQAGAAGEWLAVNSKQTRRFGHASVELAAGSRVRFDASSSTLSLAQGSVEVDVEASRAQPFRVATQHFRVEVLGTRFEVAPRSVAVKRGHVQIFALDGTLLAADLAAGGSYSYRPETVLQPAAGAERAQAALQPARAQAALQPAGVSAEVWLDRARAALGRGESAEALVLVTRAEASQPRRVDRAEAGTLRAEAAQLSRDFGAALARYREVAQRFADLPAGDNAEFAAAQLAAREKPGAERALLEQYLAHHSRGRFADEARRRLQQLPGAR